MVPSGNDRAGGACLAPRQAVSPVVSHSQTVFASRATSCSTKSLITFIPWVIIASKQQMSTWHPAIASCRLRGASHLSCAAIRPFVCLQTGCCRSSPLPGKQASTAKPLPINLVKHGATIAQGEQMAPLQPPAPPSLSPELLTSARCLPPLAKPNPKILRTYQLRGSIDCRLPVACVGNPYRNNI